MHCLHRSALPVRTVSGVPRALFHASPAGVQDSPGLPEAAHQALPDTLTRHKSQLEALLQEMGALNPPPGSQALLQQHALHALEAAAANLHQQQGGHVSQQPSKRQRAGSHASARIQRMASHADAAALHQQLQEHHQHLHRNQQQQQQQLDDQQQDLAGSQEASADHSCVAGQRDESADRPTLSPAAEQLLSSRSATGHLQSTRRLAWSPSASAGSGSGGRGDTSQDIVHSKHGSQRRPGRPGILQSTQKLAGPRFKTGRSHCLRARPYNSHKAPFTHMVLCGIHNEVPCSNKPASCMRQCNLPR